MITCLEEFYSPLQDCFVMFDHFVRDDEIEDEEVDAQRIGIQIARYPRGDRDYGYDMPSEFKGSFGSFWRCVCVWSTEACD